jgi:hypothetical protein
VSEVVVLGAGKTNLKKPEIMKTPASLSAAILNKQRVNLIPPWIRM